MRTSLKILATSFSLLGCATAASAQQPPHMAEWPLGMAIAYQGDMALVAIRKNLKQSIPEAMSQRMSQALPQEVSTAADSGYTADAGYTGIGIAH